jgi:hypothetical protein
MTPKPIVNPDLTPEQLKLGIEVLSPDKVTIPRLMVGTVGFEKVGKTYWACTAPGGLGIVSTDPGTREIAEGFVKRGKLVKFLDLTSPEDLKKEFGGKSEKDRIAVYEKEWAKATAGWCSFVEDPQIHTIIADTFQEMWGLCRLASLGDYKLKASQYERMNAWEPVNREFRMLVKMVMARPDLNCVLVHKLEKEYKDNAKGESSWTGKWERKGMKDVPFLVDVNVENYMRRQIGTSGKVEGIFGVRVVDAVPGGPSRFNPADVLGAELEGPECAFGYLGMLAFPETDFAYWGIE